MTTREIGTDGTPQKGRDMPVDEYDLSTLRTQDEAAEFLGVSARTMRRIVHDGELDVVRIGSGRGRPMITLRALLDYANRHHIRATPGAPS